VADRQSAFVPRVGQPHRGNICTWPGRTALGIALVPSTMQSVRMNGLVNRRLHTTARVPSSDWLGERPTRSPGDVCCACSVISI
jgi:hypothetical protein